MEDYETFMNSVNLVDSNLKHESILGRTLRRGEDHSLHFDDIGVLSNRALGNLSRSLSIPKTLLNNVSESTLNILIKEQLARRSLDNYRMSVLDGQILFLQPEYMPYISYEKLISGQKKNPLFVRGNPALDNVVSLFYENRKCTPSDGHPVSLGYNLRVSSTCVKQPEVSPMTFREVCSNGMLSINKLATYKISLEANNENMIHDMIKSCSLRMKEVTDGFEDFISSSMNRKIKLPYEEVFEDIEHSGGVPKKVFEFARATAQSLEDDNTYLEDVGIEQLSTIWSYINLFTFVVQSITSYVAVERTERAMYNWANLKMNPKDI